MRHLVWCAIRTLLYNPAQQRLLSMYRNKVIISIAWHLQICNVPAGAFLQEVEKWDRPPGSPLYFYKGQVSASCWVVHSMKLRTSSNCWGDKVRSCSATLRHSSFSGRAAPTRNSSGVVSNAAARRIIVSSEGTDVARSILDKYWLVISHNSATFAWVNRSFFLRRAIRRPIM